MLTRDELRQALYEAINMLDAGGRPEMMARAALGNNAFLVKLYTIRCTPLHLSK